MENFVAGYNDMKQKTTGHKYNLNFMPKTRVVNAIDESFPVLNFNFLLFFDILIAPNLDETKLFGKLNKYT